MMGLLTFTTHGTYLAPGRGWIDRGTPATSVPEPRPSASARPARPPRRWPAARLTAAQQDVVIADLPRIATLRGFRLDRAVADVDHVHVLLRCDTRTDVPRLVQLVKGALSRALTVAAGDAPATSVRGTPLEHHKWWARQYSFRRVPDERALERIRRELTAHAGRRL